MWTDVPLILTVFKGNEKADFDVSLQLDVCWGGCPLTGGSVVPSSAPWPLRQCCPEQLCLAERQLVMTKCSEWEFRRVKALFSWAASEFMLERAVTRPW